MESPRDTPCVLGNPPRACDVIGSVSLMFTSHYDLLYLWDSWKMQLDSAKQLDSKQVGPKNSPLSQSMPCLLNLLQYQAG